MEIEVVAEEGDEQEKTGVIVGAVGKVPKPRAGVCMGTAWIQGGIGRVKFEGGWPSTRARRAVSAVKPPKVTRSSWIPNCERGGSSIRPHIEHIGSDTTAACGGGMHLGEAQRVGVPYRHHVQWK